MYCATLETLVALLYLFMNNLKWHNSPSQYYLLTTEKVTLKLSATNVLNTIKNKTINKQKEIFNYHKALQINVTHMHITQDINISIMNR